MLRIFVLHLSKALNSFICRTFIKRHLKAGRRNLILTSIPSCLDVSNCCWGVHCSLIKPIELMMLARERCENSHLSFFSLRCLSGDGRRSAINENCIASSNVFYNMLVRYMLGCCRRFHRVLSELFLYDFHVTLAEIMKFHFSLSLVSEWWSMWMRVTVNDFEQTNLNVEGIFGWVGNWEEKHEPCHNQFSKKKLGNSTNLSATLLTSIFRVIFKN